MIASKDSPLIAFRGKLDTLCAMILEAQLLGDQHENRAFTEDMQEVLDFTRSLLSAEYKGIPLGEFRIMGMTPHEMREMSHNPQNHFGHDHLLMHRSMGPLSLRLNLLRTAVRETELAAIAAFRDPADPAKCRREDIAEALNSLSSLLYILIYRYLPKDFSPVGKAGI